MEHAVCDTEPGGGSGLLGKRVYGRQDYQPTAVVRLPQNSYKPFWSDSKEFTRKMVFDYQHQKVTAPMTKLGRTCVR